MKTYVGIRPFGKASQVWVLERSGGSVLTPDRSRVIFPRSEKFDWGILATGSNLDQLALAILLDATDNAVFASSNFEQFAREVVRKADCKAMVITFEEIMNWSANSL